MNEPTPNSALDETWSELDKQLGWGEDEGPANQDEKPEEAADNVQSIPDQDGESLADNEGAGENAAQDEQSAAPSAEESEDDNAPQVNYDLEIEVPMPYGMETMTVGELKDIASSMHQREQGVTTRENQLMVQQNELFNIVNALGEIPEPVRQAIEQNREATLSRESQKMLAAIPTWKDQTVWQSDRASMLKLAQEYGYSETEFNNLMDARLVKLAYDYDKLRGSIAKAKREAKPKRPGKKPRSRQPQKPARNNDKRIVTADQKQAAIDALLKGY